MLINNATHQRENWTLSERPIRLPLTITMHVRQQKSYQFQLSTILTLKIWYLYKMCRALALSQNYGKPRPTVEWSRLHHVHCSSKAENQLWKNQTLQLKLVSYRFKMAYFTKCFNMAWSLKSSSNNSQSFAMVWCQILYYTTCYYVRKLKHFKYTIRGFAKKTLKAIATWNPFKIALLWKIRQGTHDCFIVPHTLPWRTTRLANFWQKQFPERVFQ